MFGPVPGIAAGLSAVEFVREALSSDRVRSVIRPLFSIVGDTEKYRRELIDAVVRDDEAAVKNCYFYGADLDSTRDCAYRETPLMVSVRCHSINAMRALIELGADVNARSEGRDKVTALYLACRNQDLYGASADQALMIKTLLDAGANPDMVVIGGSSPLMEACYSANFAAMRLLLKYGANPNLIDSNKKTALDLCSQPEFIEEMQRAGAMPSGEPESVVMGHLHSKIRQSDMFKSGFLLPQETLSILNSYPAGEGKIKKYAVQIPSLIRSVLIGRNSKYILYDSNQYFTKCKGCSGRNSPNNYLGKGGEAKVKIVQDTRTGEFFAARISDRLGDFEIDILSLFGQFVDYIEVDGKHYVVQRLHMGVKLSNYMMVRSAGVSSRESEIQIVTKIMINLLKQVYELHRGGFIHRDLSGDNVMIDLDTLDVSLIDFGMAIRTPTSPSEYPHSYVRKMFYPLAPELQAAADSPRDPYPYSEQTDIYAVGNILGELLECFSTETSEQFNVICQRMQAAEPRKRMNARYYLNVFKSWS